MVAGDNVHQSLTPVEAGQGTLSRSMGREVGYKRHTNKQIWVAEVLALAKTLTLENNMHFHKSCNRRNHKHDNSERQFHDTTHC